MQPGSDQSGYVTVINTFVHYESLRLHVHMYIPYFLGYKTDFFSFQNNPKDLDPSYKMDLDL